MNAILQDMFYYVAQNQLTHPNHQYLVSSKTTAIVASKSQSEKLVSIRATSNQALRYLVFYCSEKWVISFTH